MEAKVIITGGVIVRFTIWNYIIPTFGVFVLTFLICVAICVVYYFVKPKAKRNLSVAVVIPSLASLTMILSFIYAHCPTDEKAYINEIGRAHV